MAFALSTPGLAGASDAAVDEAAVKTIVESVATLADTRNFEALEKLYANETTIDYSSLNGAPAEVRSPQALMTEWASVLPGFDRTRHDLSNVKAAIDGNRATATASVSAGHWIDGAYWRVDGRYEYRLAKEAGEWAITYMALLVENETGSRDVFGPAMEAVAATPASYILRQQTKQAVLDFLTGLEEKDMARVNGVWAEDAVQEMPYTPADFPGRVVGRDALIALYAEWPRNTGEASFTDGVRFYPSTDPRIVFAEFTGSVEVIPTGRVYNQRYGGLFHVDGGKITLYREYFDPRAFAEAFGLDNGGAP